MPYMASVRDALTARQAVPTNLNIPPGIDPLAYLLSMPALSPDQIPPGADRTMTLDGPDQIWYLVVAITCIAIPGLFLLVRLYTKLAIVRSLEIADYFIFLGFPLIVAEVAMGYYMVKWGAGVHQWKVTYSQLFNQLYWANIAQIIYCPLSFVVKMAILLQYLRLFAPSRSVNKVMWYGAWATIVSCFVFYSVLMFWTMFYCTPRHAIWNKFTPHSTCHDVNTIIIAQGAFNMGSDIVVLLLPTSGLWQLNVPLGRKIAVTALFATGLLACAASAMRIVFTVKIAPVISMADVSHNGLFIGIWTEAEVSLGFIVACALCLPKLIQAKGRKLKQALSVASSPFSTLRETFHSVSRRSTSHIVSQTTMQSTPGDSTPIDRPNPARPAFYEAAHEMQRQQQAGRLQRNTHNLANTAASSLYSQSPEPKQALMDDFPAGVAPLRIRSTSKHQFRSGAPSPTQGWNRDHFTAEKLREEIRALEQLHFDAIRQSIENAVTGNKV